MARPSNSSPAPDPNPGIKREQQQPGQDLGPAEEEGAGRRDEPGPGAKAPGMAPRQPG